MAFIDKVNKHKGEHKLTILITLQIKVVSKGVGKYIWNK